MSKNKNLIKNANLAVAALIVFGSIIQTIGALYLMLSIRNWAKLSSNAHLASEVLFVLGFVILIFGVFGLVFNFFIIKPTNIKQANALFYVIPLFLSLSLTISTFIILFGFDTVSQKTTLLILVGLNLFTMPILIFTGVAELKNIKVKTLFNFKSNKN
ncbi:hypothetical protein [Mycoplasma buteonis]|uniref:hypothetical protein n=1 Tax=Mycoplasma buteonis TaxID=171280 RepID=UPI0005649812|nr:hypothetical protein [Mycoplasma buteonis]